MRPATGSRRGAWLGLGLALVIAATPSCGRNPASRPAKPASRKAATGRAVRPSPTETPPTAEARRPADVPGRRLRVPSTATRTTSRSPAPPRPATRSSWSTTARSATRSTSLTAITTPTSSRTTRSASGARRRSSGRRRRWSSTSPRARTALGQIYIRNTISLKGLEPGDYELTIILHDELDKGGPASRQVVKFKVIPPDDPRTRCRRRQGGRRAAGR